MRIITGSARGKKLVTLEGEQVRPTSDRVKESLFNIVQFDLEGRRILDLFAGSGQIGLEAISRGASHAAFVDSAKESIEVIQKNVAHCGFQNQVSIYQMDFPAFFASTRQKFDLAFLDPPYSKGMLQRALPLTVQVMNPGGTVLCEHPVDERLPQEVGEFCAVKSYRYGKVCLTMYRRKDVSEG